MDDEGTEVQPKKVPPVQLNQVIPQRNESEILDDGPQQTGEAHLMDELEADILDEYTQREEKQPLETETALLVAVTENLAVTEKQVKTIEGKVKKQDKKDSDKVQANFIVLENQILSLHRGESKEGKTLHQFEFPNGAEYTFDEDSDEKRLIITDKKGFEIRLIIEDQQLYEDILIEWYRKFLKLDEKAAESNISINYKETNYSLTFNPPSSKEFGMIYYENHMNSFQFYCQVDGKLQIKNAADYKYKYRPNMMMASSEQKQQDEGIIQHMEKRTVIQWAPSRDWSRLFVLSMTPNNYQSDKVELYLEFYNFNDNEKQTILSSPLRINFLSQLLRPLWIKVIANIDKSIASECKIEASFTTDNIFITTSQNEFQIIYLKPDLTHKGTAYFTIQDASIESISSSFSKLFVASDGIYYEYGGQLSETQCIDRKFDVELDKNFSETKLKKIIQFGIYDILIYEENAKMFSYINPKDEIVIDDEILELFQTDLKYLKKFIQLDDNSIAYLAEPIEWEGNTIHILDIKQDKLIARDEYVIIELKSPKEEEQELTDFEFNIMKFKENEYVALIVTSQKWTEQYFQYYSQEDGCFKLQNSQKLSYYISLKQIPHFPFVALNGNLFINCETQWRRYAQYDNLQVELDINKDKSEILNQDFYNVYSEELQVYDNRFKKFLFNIIEEKQNPNHKFIQSEDDLYQIEIPELKALVSINPEKFSVSVFQPFRSLIQCLSYSFQNSFRSVTYTIRKENSSSIIHYIMQNQIENSFFEVLIKIDPLRGAFLLDQKRIFQFDKVYELKAIYLSDDLRLSLLLIDKEAPERFNFFQYQKNDNNWHFQADYLLEFNEELLLNEDFTSKVSSIIKFAASKVSLMLDDSILEQFKQIILKKNPDLDLEGGVKIFAFQSKFILFFDAILSITILDDQLAVISRVTLPQNGTCIKKFIVSNNKEANGLLEFINDCNFIQPFPILLSQTRDFDIRILDRYSEDFRCLVPCSFGLREGFISLFDLAENKLTFFQSYEHLVLEEASGRIELTDENDSFIDKLIDLKGRKKIEEHMNQYDINHLLSYNIKRGMSLISRTEKQDNRGLIYDVLYQKLEAAEVQELPMLIIQGISLDSRLYENTLEVLSRNSAFKLAQLIISLAIKQDQTGYMYNELTRYLGIFSSNELHEYLESQIFFSKISKDFYKEYQSISYRETIIKPESNCKSLPEIQEKIQKIEQAMLAKDNIQQIEESPVKIPIEYYAINLMFLEEKDAINSHKKPIQMIIDQAEKDPTILEIESVQIIIDFKWNSYAQKFFAIQLFLFICFIIAFIIDIAAVNKNSHFFESNDLNQVIPRIISMAIMILFAIYEFFIFYRNMMTYIRSFWNLIDLLFIFLYAAYFVLSFLQPEYEYALKSLQLQIVILSFIKVSFLIRIWKQVSFLVRMLTVVFKEILIFLFYFLIAIAALTVMAQIIIDKSGEEYKGISDAANFVIVLRQALGDYDTSSIIDGTEDFKILAWLLWFVILIIGNIVFMNFIIAVVSESYENCMEKKIQLIYTAKLDMIEECEAFMPDWFFKIYQEDWFPKFIIIRREQGKNSGGEDPNEWMGFVRQITRDLKQQTQKLNEFIKRSNHNQNKELKTELEGVKDQFKTELGEVKDELKTELEEVRKKMTIDLQKKTRKINQILFLVFKNQIDEYNETDPIEGCIEFDNSSLKKKGSKKKSFKKKKK